MPTTTIDRHHSVELGGMAAVGQVATGTFQTSEIDQGATTRHHTAAFLVYPFPMALYEAYPVGFDYDVVGVVYNMQLQDVHDIRLDHAPRIEGGIEV